MISNIYSHSRGILTITLRLLLHMYILEWSILNKIILIDLVEFLYINHRMIGLKLHHPIHPI